MSQFFFRLFTSRLPSTIPTPSIKTSIGLPLRPATKFWWYSSLIAYKNVIATAGTIRQRRARAQRNVRRQYSAACRNFRPTMSQTPSPLVKCGWSESMKMTAITTKGGNHRDIVLTKLNSTVKDIDNNNYEISLRSCSLR